MVNLYNNIKKMAFSVCLATVLAFNLCVIPEVQAEVPVVSVVKQKPVIAHLKMKPIRGTVERLMETIRRLNKGEQLEFMSFFVLGFLGHPNYPDISAEENLSVFVFSSDDEDVLTFILLKPNPEGPSNLSVPSPSWGKKELDGWVLIGDQVLIDSIDSIDAFVALNQQTVKGDIEVQLNVAEYIDEDDLNDFIALLEDAKEESPEVTLTKDLNPFNTGSDVLAEIKQLGLVLDFASDDIIADFSVEFKEDSLERAYLLADFLHELGEERKVFNLGQESAAFSFTSEVNPDVMPDRFFASLSKKPQASSIRSNPGYLSIVQDFCSHWDASTMGVLKFR